MKRLFIIVITLASVAGVIFFGIELTKQNDRKYAPENVFSEIDEQVLLINRFDEVKTMDIFTILENNSFISSIESIPWGKLRDVRVYLSKKRSIALFEHIKTWTTQDIELVSSYFKESSTNIYNEGAFLLLVRDTLSIKPESSLTNTHFLEKDKKASANSWDFQGDSWKRTDIYALEKGYFEYKSKIAHKNFGKAVDDIELFSSVLPQNIEMYSFKERFYAVTEDSVLKNSPLNEWLDKGLVTGKYKGEKILITDYKAQQTPSIILLEKSLDEDSVFFDGDIKSFTGFQLTAEFPSHQKGRVYLVEIEDKTIFTESKSLAQNIMLKYSLGETLALNNLKRNQFFEGLPRHTNARFIDRDLKQSTSFKGKLRFEVSTLPPGENLVMTTTDNWSFNPNFDKIAGFTPIKDHLRGGFSLFCYDNQGNYILTTQNGEVVWSGKTDTSIVGKPKTIDLFENNKKQLLFTTHSSVYLIDLNGHHVSSFPYQSESIITTGVSTFKWNNKMRFLVGNEKGELYMLDNSGQELNVLQIDKYPLKATPFALNVGGNLRAWVTDDSKTTKLAYLETPAKAEKLINSNAEKYIKSSGTVFGFYNKENKVYKEAMQSNNPIFIAEGKLLEVTDQFISIQKNNEVSYFSHSGDLLQVQKLKFNEVGHTDRFFYNNEAYIGVFDYLENNYFLYDSYGEILDGFPKEAKKHVAISLDKKEGVLAIYTVLNNTLICYKYQF